MSSGRRLALCLWLALGAGCGQSDDLVAHVSLPVSDQDGGRGDAGALDGDMQGGTATPPASDAGVMDRCAPSSNYPLLAAIVAAECEVLLSDQVRALVSAFFGQQMPAPQQGEERPPSICEVFGNYGNLYYPEGDKLFLCPAYCDLAKAYVGAESARIFACQVAAAQSAP